MQRDRSMQEHEDCVGNESQMKLILLVEGKRKKLVIYSRLSRSTFCCEKREGVESGNLGGQSSYSAFQKDGAQGYQVDHVASSFLSRRILHDCCIICTRRGVGLTQVSIKSPSYS